MTRDDAILRLTTLIEQMSTELESMLDILRTTHETIAAQQSRIEALEAMLVGPMSDDLPLPPEAA